MKSKINRQKNSQTGGLQNNREVFWNDLDKSIDGNLHGKVAVVTGGGKGIGKAIVENFLGNDAKVVIVTRSSGKDFAKNRKNCYHKICDVRDYKRAKVIVDEIVDELGKIDILVNCAGYAFLTSIKKESEELFDKIMDINFKGVRNFMVASANHLEDSKGVIINLGSIWALPGVNLPGDSTYSAGDAAIVKYSEVAAEEFNYARVNSISPALVETTMNDDMTERDKQEMAEKYEGRDTLLRPEEIASVAEFIVKNNINQKNIIIDAGYIRNSTKKLNLSCIKGG